LRNDGVSDAYVDELSVRFSQAQPCMSLALACSINFESVPVLLLIYRFTLIGEISDGSAKKLNGFFSYKNFHTFSILYTHFG